MFFDYNHFIANKFDYNNFIANKSDYKQNVDIRTGLKIKKHKFYLRLWELS